jgi:two-component system sensor histidine kinase BaeS
MFLVLAGQALIAAAVPGALLTWNLHHGFQAHQRADDTERLGAFAALAGEAARAGKPLAQLVTELDQRDADGLGGRVSLVTPTGGAIAGPTVTRTYAERPVAVDGRTVALARIVREPRLTRDDRAFLTNQFLGVAAIVGALFALLMIAAYVIARRWAKPQYELYRISRDVIEGEQDVDFPEIGPAETVSTMRNLSRIASRFDRLETARRTWLVTISEELRRPTYELGQRLEVLEQQGPTINPDLMAALNEDKRRLAQMAEDLHAVALADLGRLPVNFTQVDPRALIHNAVWAGGKRAKAKGVSLETSTLPEHTILVKWDAPRIEQLFDALLENSLRYTPAGGRIVLGLESQRDAWRLIIDDSAPGIDVGLAQRLFEPFYRAAENPGESLSSSGLGLATARAIVEAHHGRIEAGRSPIGGLRITVVLPANPPTA